MMINHDDRVLPIAVVKWFDQICKWNKWKNLITTTFSHPLCYPGSVSRTDTPNHISLPILDGGVVLQVASKEAAPHRHPLVPCRFGSS
ncbi:putative protein QUIRKY [Iris pallida]|uniref:Uncharacterized protein n=1 Tax=Iris pallida TaxID=29817 RepID=A0AAX6GLA7_IRIPA|nr:putative protein QUIRKY [Iris pallida]